MKKHIFTVASLLVASILGCYPVHGMNPEEVKEFYPLRCSIDLKNELYSKATAEMLKAFEEGDVDTVSRIVRSYEGIANSEFRLYRGPNSNLFVHSTPLILACRACRFSERGYDIVKLLLQNGANANATDHRGRTALHMMDYDPEVIDLLLEHGADISVRDEDGRTVLFGKKNVKVVSRLIKEGVDAKAVDELGVTALHVACERLYKPELIAILADVSDVNAKFKFHLKTPLHFLVKSAAAYECWDNDVLENVRILLRKGADPSIGDEYGDTPLDYVERGTPPLSTEGEAEVAALLRAAMEK